MPEIDWTKSMQQTFEFYEVDPGTWKNKSKINDITSFEITRDASIETLETATFECTESDGEYYIRAYLVAIQNRTEFRFPLGTFLVQTPSYEFDGKNHSLKVDAYSPLLELKENPPDLGYSILKNEPNEQGVDAPTNIMKYVVDICKNYMRAPVMRTTDNDAVLYDNYVSNIDDSWLSFTNGLLTKAKYSFVLDELGQVSFEKNIDYMALTPRHTYDDSNSSILQPKITINRDLYKIPNVVEVVCSRDNELLTSVIKNTDPNSPVSIQNRGREIRHRDTNPSLSGIPNQEMLDEYATQLLKTLSTLQYTVTYTHGYTPVRVGDCVLLNYKRAGLYDVKAKVISQKIKLESGMQVSETAVYINRLYGG